MTITKDEANVIRTKLALLEQSTSDTLKAIREQSDSGKELLKSVHGLTLEIREERIERKASEEVNDIKDKYIQEQIADNKERISFIHTTYIESLNRLKVMQGRRDKFIDSVFSKGGAMVLTIICIAVLYVMGVNPKDFKL